MSRTFGLLAALAIVGGVGGACGEESRESSTPAAASTLDVLVEVQSDPVFSGSANELGFGDAVADEESGMQRDCVSLGGSLGPYRRFQFRDPAMVQTAAAQLFERVANGGWTVVEHLALTDTLSGPGAYASFERDFGDRRFHLELIANSRSGGLSLVAAADDVTAPECEVVVADA